VGKEGILSDNNTGIASLSEHFQMIIFCVLLHPDIGSISQHKISNDFLSGQKERSVAGNNPVIPPLPECTFGRAIRGFVIDSSVFVL
jgi:hypothetical protein